MNKNKEKLAQSIIANLSERLYLAEKIIKQARIYAACRDKPNDSLPFFDLKNWSDEYYEKYLLPQENGGRILDQMAAEWQALESRADQYKELYQKGAASLEIYQKDERRRYNEERKRKIEDENDE